MDYKRSRKLEMLEDSKSFSFILLFDYIHFVFFFLLITKAMLVHQGGKGHNLSHSENDYLNP